MKLYEKNCLHFFQEDNQSFDNVLIVLKFDECNVIINSIVKFNTVISQRLNFFRMKKGKKFFLHFIPTSNNSGQSFVRLKGSYYF